VFLCVQELAFLEPNVQKDNACSDLSEEYSETPPSDIPTSANILNTLLEVTGTCADVFVNY
jgi:hypothetical protein